MKLQTIIITYISLVTPVTVIAQSNDMFGDYPYCDGCDSIYKDEEGKWNIVNNKWCKVNEEKCKTITAKCGNVDGYPCCSDSSSTVYYTDFDEEWDFENNNWCLLKPLEKFTDFTIGIYSNLDRMPFVQVGENGKIQAYFSFSIEIEQSVYLEKYQIEDVMLNGHQIGAKSINFAFNPEGFCFFQNIMGILTILN